MKSGRKHLAKPERLQKPKRNRKHPAKPVKEQTHDMDPWIRNQDMTATMIKPRVSS